MPAISPNEAEVRCLELETSTDLDLVLFVNDLTPDEETVAGDLVMPTTAGWAPITFTGGTWTITPGDPAVATQPVSGWTLNPASDPTVYGWALIDRGTPDRLVRIERWVVNVTTQPEGRVALLPRVAAS